MNISIFCSHFFLELYIKNVAIISWAERMAPPGLIKKPKNN
ncbi:hypothetical protein RC62_1119 [Flavobacterium aquidurense]|uniref:Uncharacterized protein n=1 Tax=Flavobacterium aquidurense TaxID=362413 RepID=A0A0Q0VZJ1_9FLAO|nr:hypothetical protein RC62_1119 [Flavobacterium aquidurense]